MANRNDHDSAWERLGTALQQRRTLLNPRWRNRRAFSADTGLNYRLIFDAEENRRSNFTTVTITALEVAYQLKPGSIAKFLDGGELTPADAPAPVARLAPVPDPAWQAEEPPPGVREHAREFGDPLLERLYDLALQGNRDPQGADMFPDDPWWADRWDSLRKEGFWSPKEIAWLIAEVLARRAEQGKQAGTG